MDTISKKKRSEIMRAIRSKDSKMELALRQALDKLKIKYRKNVSGLPGKPDIVFDRKRVALFLDSCFWHGCGKHCRLPSSNKKYWASKIRNNKTRDRLVSKKYGSMGWKVLRFWEHDLSRSPEKILNKIKGMLKK